MPFTPFHFGPGYLLRSVPRSSWFSFPTFALCQVVIDVETLVNMLSQKDRLHTFFHTFLGCHVAAALTVALGFFLWPIGAFCARPFQPALAKLRIWEETRPGLRVLVVSAWIGAWTHVWFDAINHGDVRPFWPWSEGNPFHGWLDGGTQYACFFFAGLAGFALVVAQGLWARRPRRG